MAKNVKVTIFFEAKRYSWTESLYTRTTYDSLAAAAARAKGLVEARVRLLGTVASIAEVRLSYGDGSRASYLLDPTTYTAAYVPQNTPTGASDNADESYSAVLVRMSDSLGHRKLTYLSGYPDLIVTTRATPANDVLFSTDFNTQFGLWKAELIANWAWRGKKGKLDNVTPIPVVNLAVAPAPNAPNIAAYIATASLGTIAIGSRIQLTGFSHVYGAPVQVNGLWTVLGFDPGVQVTGIVLRGSSAIEPADVLKLGGVIQPTYDFFAIAAVAQEGVTHRKRGVRALGPLGRLHKAK
jgi:hypothetical protein